MRAVVQRVKESRVEVKGRTVGQIGPGLLVLLGVGLDDTEQDCLYLADKISHLRIFPDNSGRMNLSVMDTAGSILVVSQFTLWADCTKGRRPSFVKAAEPDKANLYYQKFIELMKKRNLHVAAGQFQEMMDVFLINDGPVTLMLDSKKTF